MAPLNTEQTSEGQHMILFAQDKENAVLVDFSTSNPKDELSLPAICTNPMFNTWASLYTPRKEQRLKLTHIQFQKIVYKDDELSRIELIASGIRSPDNLSFSTPIVLCGSRVAVLIVLRVAPEGAAPAANQDVEGGGAGGGRHRDYIVFIKHPRLTIGAPESREIPCGTLDSSGRFVGPVAELLRRGGDIDIHDSQLVDMSSLSLPPRWDGPPRRSLGVALDPELLDERVRLMLYRENVERDFITKLQAAVPHDTLAIDVCPLNDAWKMTSDAKTFSALFLFHELRYHMLMPKYRPPRDSKKVPTFTTVENIDPNGRGYNLRVKVVNPATLVPHPVNATREVGQLTVGDGTGVVNLRLSAAQMAALADEVSTKGNKLILRNVNIDMSGGHVAIITDKFGKIAVAAKDDAPQFEFEPYTALDVSAAEYEERVLKPSKSVPPQNRRTDYRGDIRQEVRSGGVRRGRGRGRM